MICKFNGSIDIPDIARLEVKIKGPAQFCLGTEVELKTATFKTYQWSSGGEESTVIANQAGMYQVTVTNDQDCVGTASFSLENYMPLPIEIIANQTHVFEGDSVNIAILIPTSEESITIEEWTSNSRINCKTCLETTYYPNIEKRIKCIYH